MAGLGRMGLRPIADVSGKRTLPLPGLHQNEIDWGLITERPESTVPKVDERPSMSSSPILDAARAEIANRISVIDAKIKPLRDTIALYETQERLCQAAIDAIDAILSNDPSIVNVNLGNPIQKET